MREVKVRLPAQILLLGVVLVYAGLLIIAPLVSIIQGAFAKGVAPLLSALSQPDVIAAFQLTFELAVGAVIFNTIAGLIIAWVLVRHRFPGKALVDAIIDTPFAFSPVIIGYALIVLFGRNGWLASDTLQIVYSWPGMLLVTIFVSLPFVVREVQPVLAAMTVEQEEAAYTLGAGSATTFRRIVLPQIWRALLYGVVLTFARSVGEFGATRIVGGGIQGVTETATIFVDRALDGRNNVGAYGVSVMLCLLSVTILIVMSLLRGKSPGKR